jgi:hypothetical protein
VLTEWEVILTYSSYLDRPVTNLAAAAERLVRNRLTHTAVLSNGPAFWLNRPGFSGDSVT